MRTREPLTSLGRSSSTQLDSLSPAKHLQGRVTKGSVLVGLSDSTSGGQIGPSNFASSEARKSYDERL